MTNKVSWKLYFKGTTKEVPQYVYSNVYLAKGNCPIRLKVVSSQRPTGKKVTINVEREDVSNLYDVSFKVKKSLTKDEV